MEITENNLREMIIKALYELNNSDNISTVQRRIKIYMVCTFSWSEEYLKFLSKMEKYPVDVYAVVHESCMKDNYDNRFKEFQSCKDVVLIENIPFDLDDAITIFPTITQDILSKSALLIEDTHENLWISNCIKEGGKIIFSLNGLPKFSGKESQYYKEKVLSYYTDILKYNIEISKDFDFLWDIAKRGD